MQDQINSVSFPSVKGSGSLKSVLLKRAMKTPSLKIRMPRLKAATNLPRITTKLHNQWKP